MEAEVRVRYGSNTLLPLWAASLVGVLIVYLHHKGFFQDSHHVLGVQIGTPILLFYSIWLSLVEVAVDRQSVKLRLWGLKQWGIAQIVWRDGPSYSIGDEGEHTFLRIHTPDEHVRIWSYMSGYKEAVDFLLTEGIIPKQEAIHL